MPNLAAVILAGGRSARMGRDKAALRLDGSSLLARTVEACSALSPIVVVAASLPPDVLPGVVLTLEDPPFGGPVAGIAAGLAAVGTAEQVILLACDLPRAADVVALLLASDAGPDGVCLTDADGQPQFLAGRYPTATLIRALAGLGQTRDSSVRRLMATLAPTLVAAGGVAVDVDTVEQARAAGLD